VTALANGASTVSVNNNPATGAGASIGLTVAQALASVAVSPASATIAVGCAQTFTAQPRDSGGTPISGLGAPTWQSSDTTVATIDASTGVATGVKTGGPITITATISTKSGTAQLTATATSWTVTTPGFFYSFSGVSGQNPAITVCKGKTFTFHLSNVASNHPFCIWNTTDTNPAPGVTNNCMTGTTDVVWAVPANLTTGARYICDIHFFGNTFTVQ
jgi:hypothetical protein